MVSFWNLHSYRFAGLNKQCHSALLLGEYISRIGDYGEYCLDGWMKKMYWIHPCNTGHNQLAIYRLLHMKFDQPGSKKKMWILLFFCFSNHKITCCANYSTVVADSVQLCQKPKMSLVKKGEPFLCLTYLPFSSLCWCSRFDQKLSCWIFTTWFHVN